MGRGAEAFRAPFDASAIPVWRAILAMLGCPSQPVEGRDLA